jgi:hypothetical protein
MLKKSLGKTIRDDLAGLRFCEQSIGAGFAGEADNVRIVDGDSGDFGS